MGLPEDGSSSHPGVNAWAREMNLARSQVGLDFETYVINPLQEVSDVEKYTNHLCVTFSRFCFHTCPGPATQHGRAALSVYRARRQSRDVGSRRAGAALHLLRRF